jgi:hypothetical protein
MRRWFANLITYCEALTLAGVYVPVRIRTGMTGAERPGGPHAQLIARLLASCAADTLRLARETASAVPLSRFRAAPRMVGGETGHACCKACCHRHVPASVPAWGSLTKSDVTHGRPPLIQRP